MQMRADPVSDTSHTARIQRSCGCSSCATEERFGIQPKLTIGAANDRYEQEADRIADQVIASGPGLASISGGITRLQRQPVEDEEEEEETLQMKPAGTPVRTPSAAAAADAVASGGQSLSRSERAFFEPRFGTDLSHVRLHTDANAARAASGIGARAYTLRNHIAFAEGQHTPDTREGRRLLAHELTHTLQQGMLASRLQRDGEGDEEEESPHIEFNFNENIPIPATSGGVTGLRATIDITPVTWSIAATTGTRAAGTTIGTDGAITLDGAQTGAVLEVSATHATTGGGSETFTAAFRTASIPTGIDQTSVDSALGNADRYGAAFQHTFTSAEGSTDVLTNLRVGEKFPNLASPNAATHRIAGDAWPFGRGHDHFDLDTGTLENDAAHAWVLDSSGQFSAPPQGSTLAQGDNVTTPKWNAGTGAGIKVGDHVQSHSNQQPRNRLPVTLTVDQEFHYFNPRAASGSRWTQFTTTAHSRTLRRDGTNIEFVTTVNGEEHVEDYAGPPALTNLTASPVSTPKSAAPPAGGGPAPTPRTVSLSVEMLPDSLPTGMTVGWDFIGDDLGCHLSPDSGDPTSAELTIGTESGTVTIEVATSVGGSADRVSIRIT